MGSYRNAITILIWMSLVCGRGRADVGDPTLRTDHPHYAGEGAFQTIEDCVAFAAQGKQQPQDRALAVFHWLLNHQFHLHSPQEWNVPAVTPGTKTDDYEMVVYDANRSRFSYGYGLCGTVHAWNEPYWRALGMSSRRRAFPGHVNSEIEYGGAWHAFDTDMAGLVFRRDGIVAGYDDIASDPSLVQLNPHGIVCYPFAWPGDFDTMKKGWEQVAKGGNWYRMYNSGYSAMPGVIHLRRGETFTRHFDRDVFGGESRRRFWHVQKGGPFRNWTFVNMGEPRQDGGQANCRGNASYANAVFQYKPDLNSESWREGVIEISPNLVRHESMAGLTTSDDQPAHVTFQHFSPYVICGDPKDDTDPMTGDASLGVLVSALADRRLDLFLSVDQGQTWESVASTQGKLATDVTNQTKGRYGWWLRFVLSPHCRLDQVQIETTCQVNQTIYPRLTEDGCDVTYRTAQRAVTVVKPNWGRSEREATRDEVRSLRSSNLRYTPRSTKQPTAFTTSNNKPAEVVFQVAAPARLQEISAAARYRVRSPQPPGSEFRLDVSTDEGRTWNAFAKAAQAGDNEYSSGWVYGRADVASANISRAWIRVHLNGGGHATGLIDFEAYGLYSTPSPSPCDVTWAWRSPESPEIQTHLEKIAAGTREHRYTVPTPKRLTDAWVEMKAY